MAKLAYKGKTYTNEQEIRELMQQYGIPYERWGVRMRDGAQDDEVLSLYKPDIDKLMTEGSYVSCDLVALRPETPNLEVICSKFDKEHHHVEDEVRFTVEGEGVFEISGSNTDGEEMLKFTAEPGDLIVIPAMRRHSFYLTGLKKIRCIRLFQTKEGWEALYQKAQ